MQTKDVALRWLGHSIAHRNRCTNEACVFCREFEAFLEALAPQEREYVLTKE